MPEILGRLKKNILLKNSLWMILGKGYQVGIKAAYFVLLARTLGPDKFGIFSGTLAFIAILAHFSGFGMGNVMMMYVSRNRELYGKYFGKSLVTLLWTSVVIITGIVFTKNFTLGSNIDVVPLIFIAASELIFFKIVDFTAFAFQAVEDLKFTSALYATDATLKFLVVLTFYLFFDEHLLIDWSYLYLFSTLIAAITSFLIIKYVIRQNIIYEASSLSELKEGFYFSIGTSSKTVYADIDKTMLLKMSSSSGAGIYTAGYRVVDMSFLPLKAILGASSAKFFRFGSKGIKYALKFAYKLMPFFLGYSILVGLGIYGSAPLLPYILGNEYSSAVEVVRWLCILPFVQSLHYLLADALTGAGFLKERSYIQIFIAFLNFLLNLILIPKFSWIGAVWATLCSELVLLLAFCILVMIKFSNYKSVVKY